MIYIYIYIYVYNIGQIWYYIIYLIYKMTYFRWALNEPLIRIYYIELPSRIRGCPSEIRGFPSAAGIC